MLFQDAYHIDSTNRLILVAATSFLGGAIGMIIAVFISRVIKSVKEEKADRLRRETRNRINTLIMARGLTETPTPPSIEYYIQELNARVGQSSHHKQILINEILELKKSVSGHAAIALIALFHRLHLEQECLRHLNSIRWKKRALAIRQLSEIGYRHKTREIAGFLKGRNTTLEEEAMMGLIRLDQSGRFDFLEHYRGTITPWMTINIHNYLRQLDPRMLPAFHQWFDHPEPSVRQLSIQMATHFRQHAALPVAVQRLDSEDPEWVAEVLTLIGALEAVDYRNAVLAVHARAEGNAKIAVSWLQCISKIGDADLDAQHIIAFIDSNVYDVRYQALATLKKISPLLLVELSLNSNESITSTIRHLQEPLLS